MTIRSASWLVLLVVFGCARDRDKAEPTERSADQDDGATARDDRDRSRDAGPGGDAALGEAGKGSSAPVPDACLGLYPLAEACYGEAFDELTAAIIENAASTCQRYLPLPDWEFDDCAECLHDLYERCPGGYQQINAGISLCDDDACNDFLSGSRESLPTRPKVRITCDEPELEVCDSIDNDCDGEVDEVHICRSDEVRNAVPFEGRLYLKGATQQGSSERYVMRAIWPEWDPEAYTGLSSRNRRCYFAPGGDLYCNEYGSGIFHHADGSLKLAFPSDPCLDTDFMKDAFAVDAEGAVYFSCFSQTPIYKNHEPLTDFNAWFVGLLEDGRIIAASQGQSIKDYRAPDYRTDIVVLDARGRELSRLSPYADFGDEYQMWELANGATVVGNQATALFLRTLPDGEEDAVVYNLTPKNDWALVRHVRLKDSLRQQRQVVAISDGTVFTHGTDDDYDGVVVHGYFPDGTVQVVWHQGIEGEQILGDWNLWSFDVGP